MYNHHNHRIAAIFVSLIGLLGLGSPAWAAQSYFQAANLHVFQDPAAELAGAVTLTRTRYWVLANIRASGLDPDAAYTAWWAIFNHPDACTTVPCSSADLRNPAVAGANVYATGFITDSAGTVNVNAHLKAGELPIGMDYIDLGTGVPPQLGKHNGLQAEIHLLLRSHGPLIAGSVDQQIGSGEFGCEVCVNQQAATFLPVK